jgi:hypothetical protein
MTAVGFAPLSRTLPYWPVDILGEPDFLDEVGLRDFDVTEGDNLLSVSGTVLWLRELALDIPGLQGISVALLNEDGVTVVPFQIDVQPEFACRLPEVTASLRITSDLLRRVRREDGEWVPDTVAGNQQPTELRLGGVGVVMDVQRGLQISMPAGMPALSMPPVQLGDTGIVLEVERLTPYLSATQPLPQGAPPGFRGIALDTVRLHLPSDLDIPLDPSELTFEKMLIGTGGFSGAVRGTWTPKFDNTTSKFTGSGAGTLFGIPFALRSLSLSFVQNVPTASSIAGELLLPFFDKPIGVDISIGVDGSFAVALSAVQPEGVTYKSGIVELTKEGLFKLAVDGIGFSLQDGLFTAKLSGSITPLALGLDWPTFAVKELSIDSEGHVHLEGGWLDLPNQYALDFHGFKLEITKLGFGKTDDGKKWVGFSGGLRLVDELPAGASVEGLRLTWDEDLLLKDPQKAIQVTLNGAGVDFEVPGVVKFKGAISYSSPTTGKVIDTNGQILGDETVERFDGTISLKLVSLGLEIDAVLVVGSATGVRGNYTFFAIYLAAELPAGIPLWSTGLGLYGAAGLFALSMEPNRKPDEKWYGVGPGEGWYKRGTVGVTDLKRKWDPNPASLAFGAGVTIGTVADNGFTFAGKVLLVIVLPGPIVMLEGKANLLKERASLGDEPLFRSIAVLDNRAGFFTVGLDAQYKYEKAGEMIGIAGGVEAFYDFHDADAWHIYLGEREPRERRVAADIFQLFKANGYLMLDSRHLQTGAWVGYEKSWTFGPLMVDLEAWIEGDAVVSFKPPHFYGKLWLHGNVGAHVFGFGFALIADATCTADVFDPFHIIFELHVAVDLPWPFEDYAVDATLEWGPIPKPPPLPLPLKEIAVEHLKVTTSWPLPRNKMLLPNYDSNGDGFLDAPAGGSEPADLTKVPVVPMDGRPHLTFGRHVNDDAMVGNVLSGTDVWEQIGDPESGQGPARARYGLQEVELARWVTGSSPSWKPIARKKANTSTAAGVDALYGSWAPAPGGDSKEAGQVKLWLWSKTPFDYTRHTSRAWDEWFTDHFPGHPCPPPPSDRVVCCDFESLPLGTKLTSPWTCPDHPEVKLSWTAGAVGTVTALATPVDGRKRALCFPGSVMRDDGSMGDVVVTVNLPDGGKGVEITVPQDHGGEPPRPTCIDFANSPLGIGLNPREEQQVSFEARLPSGARATETRIVSSVHGHALDCSYGLDIHLPCPATSVELTLVHFGVRATIEAYDRDGNLVDQRPMQAPRSQPETLRIDGRAITRVVVNAPQNETHLLELCYTCQRVTVTGTDSHGNPVAGRITNGQIAISGSSLSKVDVSAAGGICIAKVCATLKPSPADIQRHEEMTEHLVAELARWPQEGDILEPNTIYRLKVVTTINVAGWDSWIKKNVPTSTVPFDGLRTQTEYAYFRTEGPPGLADLSTPIGRSNPSIYESGTVSLSNGSSKVTGANTNWSLDLVGAVFQVKDDPTTYTIGGIDSPTQLTLSQNYTGPGKSAAAYTISRFESGLEDLTRYVLQTVPATVPGPGEKPPLPRPVYRAYDVGVRFNEDSNYVELMYRIDGRDLGLYLYDNNNLPVRDALGRLIVLGNQWGEAEDRTLSESEKRWLSVIDDSTCATLDKTILPHDRTLTNADGTVLDPDTVHEGRLVPLLLHDDSSKGLAGWQAAIDQGTIGTPSKWTAKYHPTISGTVATATGSVVKLDSSADLSLLDTAFDFIVLTNDTARASKRYRITAVDIGTKAVTLDGSPVLTGGTPGWEIPSLGAVVQTSAIAGGSAAGNDPVKPGTMLVRGDLAWDDYRFSVLLRSSIGGAIGVVFRAKDANTYYRFSMDRDRKYRRLVSVVGGAHTILAEDDFVFATNTDYLLTVEAIGDSLRVYQDGELVFGVQDSAIDKGRIGLYTWSNAGARFSDVRVDDFRETTPIVYRFKFTTSQFSNFFHHLHSYQDETWIVYGDVSASSAKAVASTTSPSEKEARDYEALFDSLLKDKKVPYQDPPRVEVTRIDHEHQAQGFLVRSPEPIDWKRTSLKLSRAARTLMRPSPPTGVKLTAATMADTNPNDESVTLLLREATDLTGYRMEHRSMPAALADTSGNGALFADDFDGPERGLLFREDFGPNALDHYTIVDQESPGLTAKTSLWSVAGGHIVQTANYMGGGSSETKPEKPGALVVTGSSSWTNVRITATLRAEDYDDVGVVFRYRDEKNYYRFSMSRFGQYRRLMKRVNGKWNVLWEDHTLYTLNQSYRLTIEAVGDSLLGYLDDQLLFGLRDGELAGGRVGFYCWRNTKAHFESLRVESLEAPLLLWQPAFDDVDEVVVVDDGVRNGPSNWSVQGGVLRQSSGMQGPLKVPPGSTFFPGTYALGGDEQWEDVQLSVRLRSDNPGAIGVIFRYQDEKNYYRFSMDRSRKYRRLIRRVNGVVKTLWQDAVQYTVGQRYELTLRAVGSELRGFLDGSPLFTVRDGTVTRGRIGLYCSANPGARFERVLVVDRTRRMGKWAVRDDGVTGGASVWRLVGGAMVQSTAIGGGTAPDAPGTIAVGGDRAWDDYRLRVRLRPDDPNAIGVVFRYRDADNYYRLSLDKQRNQRQLVRRLDGNVTTLWTQSGGFTVGETIDLTVDAVGTQLKAYIGRTRLFEVTDTSHAKGRVGLYSWNNPGARFERVEVLLPPLEARALLRDHFGTGDTSGWTFVDEGSTDVPSAWKTTAGELHQTSSIHTPPIDRNTLDKPGTYALAGDSSWDEFILSTRLRSESGNAIGVMFGYQDKDNYYRFSMDRQQGYRRLVSKEAGTFELLWEDSIQYETKHTYDLTVFVLNETIRGFIDGVPLFVVPATGAKGKIGLYCWHNTDARFSNVAVYPALFAFRDWLIDEKFDPNRPSAWTYVDDGDQDGPSNWVFKDGLIQTSDIHGGSDLATAPDKPGTYAVSGDPQWGDYRFTTLLTSKDPDAIGVMFRYRDNDNYYRFSMDRSRKYRRLIRKEAGNVEVLWEDGVPFETDREYLLTIDCAGEVLRGFLDGLPLFTIADESHATGRVGLYCWKNTAARFLEVRVATPVWTRYYTFGPEERMAAGARVRVHAGNAADVTTAEVWGVERRFAASLDERGRLKLAPSDVNLRLLAPGAESGHTRGFVDDGDYVEVPTKVLREADGTGIALFPATGNTLSSGQYRLKLTYARDNSAADKESTVLRERGNTSSEEVEIDIPWLAR